MKLTFIGADHEVTGSCHYLEAAGKKILVDYGMEQGRNVFENMPLPVPESEIDFVFVTHAHIDHTGLLPLLGKRGFHGKIYATTATCDLCNIMLLDSAGIQEFEAEWRTRKGKRKGLAPYVPLYTAEDAEKICQRFVPCAYGRKIRVCDGVWVRFTDIGHLLGSAAVEVWVTETKDGGAPDPKKDAPWSVAEMRKAAAERGIGEQAPENSEPDTKQEGAANPDRTAEAADPEGNPAKEEQPSSDLIRRKLVFSGDIGNTNQPLINDPQKVEEADYLLIESTYGDRTHGDSRPDYVKSLAQIIQRTFDRGGNVVVPSFAIGRTQELLYFLRQIKEQGLVKGHPHFPVYVDSPLAVRATGIFNEHTTDCFDPEAAELVAKGINPIAFPDLELSLTTDESKAINTDETPKVILSASGMCEAGRIKHHLKHNLWRPESTVLFVGYQGEGTLGRSLLNGAKEVTLFGESIAVKAEILSLPGISGHADQNGLLDWAAQFTAKPVKVFVVHGDDAVMPIFTELLRSRLGYDAYAPYSGTIWDLVENKCLKETQGIPYRKRDEAGNPIGAAGTAGTETAAGETSTEAATRTAGKTKASKKAAAAYSRLESAAQQLLAVVHASKGLPNKELARFADQILSLCDKYRRS